MKKTYILVLAISSALLSCKDHSKNTYKQSIDVKKVQVEGGIISGYETSDKAVAIFKGIPYARPPIGNLRWKPPVPVKPWEGVIRCDAFVASPMQRDPAPFYMWSEEFLIPEKPIDEDALYLNVWAPMKKVNEKIPVLVWIHGGGFSSGSGSVPIYDGEAMAKKEVIFVSINYRLGIFGFFAHPELTQESEVNVSGNYGLLDQIAALQWVKTNISQFGGDPDNITIAGQSAGAVSVAFLVASPLAKGLFQKAIAQSGAGLLPLIPNSKSLGMKTLEGSEQVGLTISEKLKMLSINELRDLPAATLFKEVGFNGSPIIDGYVIPKSVYKIYKEGKQNKVALLTGWNENDVIARGGIQSVDVYQKNILDKWGTSGHELLSFYPATNDSIGRISQKLLKRDVIFGVQNYAMANEVYEQGKDVFMYRFARDLPDGDQADFGAFHTAEVPYAFNNLDYVNRPFEPLDYELADLMSSFWANFAKTGNPNGKGLPDWPRYNTRSRGIMMFDEQSRKGVLQDSLKLNFLVEQLKMD